MKYYDFTGHLTPLPPGIKLPLQISGKVCLPEDLQPIFSELVKLAADMAVHGSGVSSWSEDHPQRARRGYWLREIEKADDRARELAMKIRDIANKLVTP